MKRSRHGKQIRKSGIIRILSAVILLLSAISGMAVPVSAADSPWISAQGFCVIDADTGELIVGSREQEAFAPASITKIMTALVTAEQCTNLDDRIAVSEKAVTDLEVMSSTLSPMPKPGETFTVRDVLYGLVMKSGNECANMLAEYVAGGGEEFAQLMNERAARAGAVNTHFSNPHGLDADDHYTTPYDMALIMKAALENPVTAELFSAAAYTIPATGYSSQRVMTSGHAMVSGEYACDGVFAGKTGYTIRAKWTLVTAAKREGRTLIAVVMRCDEGCSYSDTEVLLSYAFQRIRGEEPSGGALVYNPQVTDYDSTGFTVVWTVGPDAVRAEFPVWIEYDDTDQMTRKSAEAGGGTVSCRVSLAEHGGRTGVYTVQAYVYDAQGGCRISTVKVAAGMEELSYGLFLWNDAWYYGKENGALALNWLETSEGCYRFDYMTARMQTGWITSGETVYYLGADGKLVNGWQEIDGNRYYFQVPGDMVTGRMRIDGFVYEFDENGVQQPLGLSRQAAQYIFESMQ